MRVVAVLLSLVVLAASALCVRLGFWQLSRLHEKQALNAAIRASERSPALIVTGEPPAVAEALDRSMRVTGRYDEAHQFLLSGMLHEGEPGVEVVTPLRADGATTAVLIDRGWLPADDATTARPEQYPEPGVRVVEGVVEPVKRGAGVPGPRRLEFEAAGADSASVALYTVRWLDRDSIAARLPYPVAEYVVRQKPGPGVPGLPRRTSRPLFDETMHLSYAIQWFLFAIAIPAGAVLFAWTRGRRAARPSPEATT